MQTTQNKGSFLCPSKTNGEVSLNRGYLWRKTWILKAKKSDMSKQFGSRTALFWMSSERRVPTMKKQDGQNHQTFVPALGSSNVTKAKKSSRLSQKKC
jgi:hypothetical protein